MQCTNLCPLIPYSDHEGGPPQNTMSALPPKADMCSALVNVRFVPIADMRSARKLRRFLSCTVASPYLVTDFFGDDSITDMEIVQQSHLHLGADGERAILKAFALTNRYRVRLIYFGMARQLGMIMAWPVAAREGALIGLWSGLCGHVSPRRCVRSSYHQG